MDGTMNTNLAPRRTDSAIGKVAAVVEALAVERRIADIAGVTGLAPSTVHRILRELVELGWARDDGERGYLLGARLLSLAGQASTLNTLSRIAHPILRDLSDRTAHTVHFALLSGDEAVYIDKIEGRRAYHIRSRIGLAVPLHCTAIGKAILAAMTDDNVRATLDRAGLVARTERTITDRDVLLEHLAEVRRRGFAIDDEENELHTRCIGTAVIDHRGLPVGAVSISALAFDLDRDRVHHLAPLVVQAGLAVSEAIGGIGDQLD
jgi:IclR family transcriptional regulator, acetate operon repressor